MEETLLYPAMKYVASAIRIPEITSAITCCRVVIVDIHIAIAIMSDKYLYALGMELFLLIPAQQSQLTRQ